MIALNATLQVMQTPKERAMIPYASLAQATTLDYRGIEGQMQVPLESPAADMMIAQGLGPLDLVEILGSKWVALGYFAGALQRLYPIAPQMGICAGCNAKAATRYMRLSWCVGLLPAAEARTISGQDEYIMTDTHHAVCEACFNHNRAILYAQLRSMRITLLSVGLLLVALVLAITSKVAEELPKQTGFPISLGAIVGLFGLCFLAFGMRPPRGGRLKPHVMPRGVVLKSVEPVQGNKSLDSNQK